MRCNIIPAVVTVTKMCDSYATAPDRTAGGSTVNTTAGGSTVECTADGSTAAVEI